MKIIMVFLLFLNLAMAQEEDETLLYALAYQQSELQLVDVEGDRLLLYLKTEGANKKLLKMLLGQIDDVVKTAKANERKAKELYPEFSRHYQEQLKYAQKRESDSGIIIEGRINPIKSKEMLLMFKQIISEEHANGITAKRGEFHRWSEEFKRENKKKFSFWQGSKLFLTLAAGSTSRFIVTGKEDLLIDWMLDQNDESINIHNIFRSSYRIHDGNIYLSILAIENVLSRYWKVANRQNLVLTRKLAPITNHFEDRGDKFGAWYHFFGLLTYGYATGSKFKSGMVGRIESLGSFITSGFKKEYQEDWINAKAGPIGAKLRHAMDDNSAINYSPDKNYANEGEYLNLTEDFRDRIDIVSNPKFNAQIKRKNSRYDELIINNNSEKNLYGCKVEVIPHIRGRFRSKSIQTFENITLSLEKVSKLKIKTTNKVRIFINECRLNLNLSD